MPMWRIGEYFSNRGAAAGLPGAVDPLDPATGQCQPNYHLLSTDGYWFNRTRLPGFVDRIGNRDLTVPGDAARADRRLHARRSRFRAPTARVRHASSNSIMADLAMYYWINDIRPDLADKVKDTIAPWQHVTFYGLSIGAEGTLDYPARRSTRITAGTEVLAEAGWSRNVDAGPEAIDDLWHAAVNSRGKYFNAQNPQQLAESIVSALADFTAQSGTGTARRDRRRAAHGDHELRLPDELRGRLVGRRQEIRARPRHRRAARRRRRQSAERAGVVGGNASSMRRRPARAGTRTGGS